MPKPGGGHSFGISLGMPETAQAASGMEAARSSTRLFEPVDEVKPFDNLKREVWEAFKKVKANQGAAGVDGQSIADFEADLSLRTECSVDGRARYQGRVCGLFGNFSRTARRSAVRFRASFGASLPTLR